MSASIPASTSRDEFDYSLRQQEPRTLFYINDSHKFNNEGYLPSIPAAGTHDFDEDLDGLHSPSESVPLDSPAIVRPRFSWDTSNNGHNESSRPDQRAVEDEGDQPPPSLPPKPTNIQTMSASSTSMIEPRKVSWRDWFSNALTSGDSVRPDQTPSSIVAPSPAMSEASSTPANDPFPYDFLSDPADTDEDGETPSLHVLTELDAVPSQASQRTLQSFPQREYLVTAIPAARLTTEASRTSLGLARCISR